MSERSELIRWRERQLARRGWGAGAQPPGEMSERSELIRWRERQLARRGWGAGAQPPGER
jgi:hypothetical protein